MTNFLKIFLVLIFVTSCNEKTELKHSDDLIKTEETFDKDQFIIQSQQRIIQDYILGPKVDKSQEINKRQNHRKLINKEESFDYIDISELDNSKKFKVDINVENMEIRDFANLISNATGVNILVSDEVGGTVTAQLKDIYWTNMLDSILKTKKLAKHVDAKSNIIRIHDQNTVVQLEDFERKRKENVQRAMLLKKSSQPLRTEVFKLFYTKPDAIKKTIDQVILTTGVNTEGLRNINPEITTDSRRNLLIVKAREQDLNIISKLISELDTRTQQVYIEAFIVEVNDSFSKAFGSRLGVTGTGLFGDDTDIGGVAGGDATNVSLGTSDGSAVNLPLAGATSGIGFLTGISDVARLKVELTALENQGLTKVISNPKIFTLDNREAEIFQGDEIPYVTVSENGTQTEFKDAGLKLTVTPTIIGDGNLQLDLQVNKDTVDSSQSNPPITRSEIKTNLVTKDGEIVVMGGIYTETAAQNKDQVPGLGDVPGVGKLFKSKQNNDNRKELIIFIAPRVL